jgi:hypothetical protein
MMSPALAGGRMVRPIGQQAITRCQPQSNRALGLLGSGRPLSISPLVQA